MDQIVTGDASDALATRGWFVGGDFLPASAGIRKNSQVEIKWGVHPKGEERAEYAPPSGTTTVCILISGSFQLEFDGGKKTLLDTQGQYVMWGPTVGHSWRIFEDSVAVTVRW